MGKVFIVSGQSGIGKNTILDILLERHPDWYKIVTCTTRPPRPTDVNGVDKVFVSKEKFMEMIEDDEFAEYAKVHNFYYCTPRHEIERSLKDKTTTLLEIDVQGSLILKEEYPEITLIFLQFEPGKLEQQIRNRFLNDPKRTKISEEEILTRIETAKKEEAYKNKYDFVITNFEGKAEQTADGVEKIINYKV